MKKVVYVTGCLGFIGSYITRACLVNGWYVKGVDSMTYAANKSLLAEFSQYDNFSFVPLLPKNLLIKLLELKNEYDN